MNLIHIIKNKLMTNEKNKEISINLVITVILKGGAYLVSFFSMPLSIKYFNNQAALGVWYTILSMLTWIFTFDLGLGNGLRNKLVDNFVKKDYKKAKENISSAYLCMIILGVFISILGFILFRHINWNGFFNINSDVISNNIFIQCMNILLVGILINFVLRIFSSILYAMQKPFLNNLLALLSSIIQVLYLYFGRTNILENNLINLCYVYIISTCFPILIATIILFKGKLKECSPNIKSVSKKGIFNILKLGINFFLIQILFMLIISTNELIISNLFDPNFVVDYQIYYKLFMTCGSLIAIALTPFWSEVTKAISENDFRWLGKTNKSLYLFAGIATVLEIFMILILQVVVNIWLGNNAIQVNYLYAIIFAIFGSTYIVNIIVTTIANGTGRLKIQTIFYLIGVIIKIPLTLLLKRLYNNWIVVILVNNIILIPFCIVQAISTNKYIKSKLKNGEM